MYYGDEKRLQMVRSILPSSKRRWARYEQRRLNKATRHQVNRDIRRCLKDEEHAYEADLYAEPYFGYYLRDRRNGDKSAHFRRWAVEVTKGLPDPSSRLGYMRGILPGGLVGWHALEHLRWCDEFDVDPYINRWVAKPDGYWKAQREQEAERRVRLLTAILATAGGHKALNRYMVSKHCMVTWVATYTKEVEVREDRIARNCTWTVKRLLLKTEVENVGPTRPRLLRGTGDIDDFLNDLATATRSRNITVEPYTVPRFNVYGDRASRAQSITESTRTRRENPMHHPEWFSALETFLDEWEEAHGNVGAIRQKLRV